MPEHRGHCHCGSLEVVYRSALPPAATEVRACQCGFCRRHGARAVSDPAGSAEFRARRPEALRLYRFGLGTADYVLCGECGCYMGAVMTERDRSWAVLCIANLEDAAAFIQPARPVDYDAEDEAARRDRRRDRWTPAVLRRD
jgi:hypothetical protein